MAVRKNGSFEALCYDATSETPVLRYRGNLDINSRKYLVHVEQGSDGSVSVDLAPGEDEGFFNIVLCSRGLVAIRYRDDADSYLSKKEFMEKSGMSASDVSGLARLLNREAKALFGSCSCNIPASLSALRSEPLVNNLRIALDKKLGPMLVELGIKHEKIMKIYDSAVEVYMRAGQLM